MTSDTAVADRALYDAGREDVFAGSPIHDIPSTASKKARPHMLTVACWCNPTVEHVQAERVTHQGANA